MPTLIDRPVEGNSKAKNGIKKVFEITSAIRKKASKIGPSNQASDRRYAI